MELSGKDASFIAYLSNFLYANGNEVLIGKKKLSLTSSVLCTLNKLYVDPNDDIFGRISNDIQLQENWRFLLNVINNVIALKVTHCVKTVQGGIDLSMFKSLLMLELKKTPIHLLLGFNEFSSRLETLVCTCSISSLHELVSNKHTEWMALKHLNLSHNYLESLQEDIRLFPNLQVIDVSHNRLADAVGLKYLTKVSTVNLGYNNLSKVPTFSDESFKFLKELSLRNNHLEDLMGLQGVRHLHDLDLSYNCLLEHSILFPIQGLPYLQVLKLAGNPLAAQRFHRVLTAKHLHPNVLIVGLKLDGRQLTKTEIGKVTQIRNIGTCHGSRNGDRVQTNLPFEEGNILRGVTVSSISYCPSFSSLDRYSVASESSLKNDTESTTSAKSDVKKGKSKSRKKKEIIIKDCGSSHQPNLTQNLPEKECKTKEFKATLAARRENLGNEWLVSTYSTSLPSESTLRSTTVAPELSREISVHNDALDSRLLNNNVESSYSTNKSAIPADVALESHPEEVDNTGKKVKKKISVASDGIEVIFSEHLHSDEIMKNDFSMCKSCVQVDRNDNSDIDFQQNRNAYDIKYGIVEDENVESNMFLVEKKVSDGGSATILVSVGEKYLKEEDVLTTDLLDSLDLSVLDTVEVLENNAIKLDFKMFKLSHREHIYYAESEAAVEKMLNLLLPHADTRNLRNIAKNALRCLKCDAQFTKDIVEERFIADIAHPLAKYILRDSSLSKVKFEEVDICPVCESSMIVEDSDCPITASLLKEANYSPSVISGYLLVSQNMPSSASVDLMSNLLLTFKHPPKTKQESVSSLSDKGTVNPHGEVGSDSDDSSVCTALEYTSQELAANCSSHSVDLADSNNLNCCVEQLPCATQGTDCSQEEEDLGDKEEDSLELNNQNKINALGESIQRPKDNYFEGMIDNADEITYDSFTNMDHTLKLYIEMQLFNANEELEASIEAVLVPHSTTIKSNGLLLLSTKRLHFMKLAESLSEEPKDNITPLEAVELHLLNTVLIFTGNQGASFIWGSKKKPSECKGCYTCLFRDADYCCTFITYFTEFMKQKVSSLPEINASSELNLSQVKQDILLAGLQKNDSSNISTEILAFIVVDRCQLAPTAKGHESVALTLTSTDICVTDISFTKHTNSKASKVFKPVECYIPLAKQKVTNLVSVHPHFDTCKIGLHFLDEDSDTELLWMITLKTRRILYLLLNTLKEPWQENFGIEMKIETPVDCECNLY